MVLTCSKSYTNTTKVRVVTQDCKLISLSFTYARILSMRENLSRSSHSLGTIIALLVTMASNKPIVTCLGSQLLNKKLTTIANSSCVLVDIHKSKVHVDNMKLTNASCPYVTKVFSNQVGKTSFTKTFFDGPPLGITFKPYDPIKKIQLSSWAKNL